LLAQVRAFCPGTLPAGRDAGACAPAVMCPWALAVAPVPVGCGELTLASFLTMRLRPG